MSAIGISPYGEKYKYFTWQIKIIFNYGKNKNQGFSLSKKSGNK
jgi:hypothetical protein